MRAHEIGTLVDRASLAQAARAAAFLPVLLEACQEDELAVETAQGSVAHGAFTYSLCKHRRRQTRTKKGMTFEQLLAQTRREVRALGHSQTPNLLGPRDRIGQRIPWHA